MLPHSPPEDASRAAPTVSIITLGCKLNQAEAEGLVLALRRRGYRVFSHEVPADVYVVNTCTVTHVADQKSRQLVRRLRRARPEARIVVTGCYAERAPQEIGAVGRVDAIVDRANRERLTSIVEELAPVSAASSPQDAGHGRQSGLGRARSLIKVGDGCDKFCSYCVVPLCRGRERSEPLDSVVAAVQQKAEAGCLEVVLTAVNLGRWGAGFGDGDPTGLDHLLAEVLQSTSIPRVRLSSIEPEDFRDELIPLLQDRRVCRHLHLPLQSGCNTVLRRMRRRYDLAGYSALVTRVRSEVLDIAITTDVMVGFPGETDREFEQTCHFVEQAQFAAVHIFKYSPRAGTAAAAMADQVPATVKAERASRLATLADESARRFRRRFLGRSMEVLYESAVLHGQTPGLSVAVWGGLTDNYLRVYAPSVKNRTNQLAATKLVGERADGMWGDLENVPPLQPGASSGSVLSEDREAR